MRAGDYVLVIDGVWDSAMPDNRPDGLVLEVFGPETKFGLKAPDQATVLFSNGAMLKFHISQLEVISESR